MKDVYESIEEYNPGKKSKVFIVFDDMIADVTSNINLHSVATELFIRGLKLNISLMFITVILPCTKWCMTKYYTFLYHENSKKAKGSTNCCWSFLRYLLQWLHRAIQKMSCKKYLFVVINTSLPSDNPLSLLNNLLGSV